MSQITYKEMRDIVLGKLVYHTIEDDYEDLSERLFGEGNCFNSSEVRKRMYGMRSIIEAIENDACNAVDGEDIISEIELKKIELQKERQKLFDQRAAYKKLLRERARQEELNEILEEAVRNGYIPRLKYEPSKVKASDNDLLVSLNDIHFGAVVDNKWNKYNSEICAKMFDSYLDRIIKIAETHSSEKCFVFSNGDAISGSIHSSIQITNKENVIEQIKGVSELISEFLAELSKHFKAVVFVSVAGNHSRLASKDDALMSERLDDLIEWYLKSRLQNFKNIFFEEEGKIDETMYVMNIRGKNYVGVHGDYDSTNKNIQTVCAMADKNIYAVLLGHIHHNVIDEVQGVKVITAGSFLGMDDYCIQKRIIGKPQQLVCVCDENGIRCSYDIPLDINSED